jgi:Sugar-specific transcriptional regulator TrmB
MSVDYVLLGSVATIVAAALIIASLLSRYSRMVKEADKSSRLAKDVWDSMNSRFAVVDARIIDLMAKTDILSSKANLEIPAAPGQVRVPSAAMTNPVVSSSPPPTARQPMPVVVNQAQPQRTLNENTDTEVRVLRLLVDGPKSSAEIKALVGRSREHTARMMKDLFERGLVVRNDRNKPYVYEITESGKSYVAS